MIGGGTLHCRVTRRPAGRLGRFLSILMVGVWAQASAASATEDIACAGLNMGRLDVVLPRGSSELQRVEMNEGDTLTFTFRTQTRATGTVTLAARDGRKQRVLRVPHGTQVSYTAERSGAVRFRLATKGEKIATFVTTCNPAGGSSALALNGLNVDMGLPLSLGIDATQDTAAQSMGAPPEAAALDTSTLRWLSGEQSDEEAAGGTYGVDLKLQPGLMIGVRAQFDPVGDPLLGPAALSDQPWMAGSMASVQLGEGLALDARATWGSGDPLIGSAADRQALDAHLTSKNEAGPWRLSSTIGFAHVEERLDTSAVASERVDIKPELAYRLDMSDSMYIEPKIMVGAFWNFVDATPTGTATGPGHQAGRVAETGITFGAADGTRLQVGGSVQEGETPTDNVWSGRMQLDIPLP